MPSNTSHPAPMRESPRATSHHVRGCPHVDAFFHDQHWRRLNCRFVLCEVQWEWERSTGLAVIEEKAREGANCAIATLLTENSFQAHTTPYNEIHSISHLRKTYNTPLPPHSRSFTAKISQPR